MATPRGKFQDLLKKLFQFDCAELDFGIYRIMNQKRAVIEQFIEKDLVKGISQELKSGALAQEAGLAQQLAEVTAQIKENIGDEALDTEGNLAAEYHGSKLGKQYLALRERAGKSKATPELEADIFNHLYAFFSRYYDEGDFMSLRRYSKRDKYAIPYNGEEVHLHWANADQYYIKTGENFTDYSYKHGGWTIQFKLRNADVEQNNVKGAKRFFIPRTADVSLDEKNSKLTIPFEFRPLNASEEISYGKGNGAEENGNGKTKAKKKKGQEGILDDAIVAIQNAAKKNAGALAALIHEKRKDADGNPVSLLEHNLRAYVRGNSTDFFIHKDLKGFLERELDFYLKNEVLNLDELEAGGEARSESWFQTLRAIKGIGRKIIAFVAQIENFQKRLFEKRKFVTEVRYCVTLDRVPEELYPEIAKNKAQIEEWKRLFHIQEIERDTTQPGFKEPVKVEFLKANPFLVLDTKFFSPAFAETLLASKTILKGAATLDEATDGLLIHGENIHALHLIKDRYREQVQCVHIDPPYNTQTSGFLYKNSYQHSSWLAMMAELTKAATSHLTHDGAFLCHVDENEYERLHLLFDTMGLPNGGTIVWDKKNPMLGRRGVATQHEYVTWRTFVEDSIYLRNATFQLILETAEKIQKKYAGVTDAARKEFADWLARYPGLTGGERSYRYLNDDGRVYQSVGMGAPEYRQDPKFHEPLIHPKTKKPCPVPDNGFSRSPTTLKDLVSKDEIIFGEDETVQPRRKVFLTPESQRQISSVIQDASRGKADLEKLGLEFPYCHPVSLYIELVAAGAPSSIGIVLDFFAGSGTNGHAVIALNREEKSKRKFILVEIGEHFDTVLKPRIQKVIYCEEWKDGKPTSRDSGISHLFKYVRLESYEDALDNITFGAADAQTMFQLEDYVLSYMLDFETKQSETLLNVAKLDAPFDYKLRRHGKDEPLPVDLPETFNYLIGLHVASRRVYENKSTRYLVYRGKADGRETVILWRTTRGWKQEQFEGDRDFVTKQKLTEGAEDIFVNTDSFIEGARSLDPVFKKKMFNED